MGKTRWTHRAAAASSSCIAAYVAIARGSGWRRFGGTCDHGCSSSTINFSPKINSSIQSFLAKAPSHPLAARAVSDLRSDHAGEWGAVKIYEGVEWAANVRLSYDSDAQALLRLIDFSRRHRESESSHLMLLSQMLPPQHRTRLLPLWTAAGFLLGAVRTAASLHALNHITPPMHPCRCIDCNARRFPCSWVVRQLHIARWYM